MNAPALTAASAAQAPPPRAARFDLVAALKDAALLRPSITLGLCIPILAFRTDQNGGRSHPARRAGASSRSSAPSSSRCRARHRA